MAGSLRGFDPNAAAAAKAARLQVKENRAAISDIAGDLADLLKADDSMSEDSEAETDAAIAPSHFTRRIVLPAGQQVDENRLVRLNQLYEAERKFWERMQTFALQRYFNSREEELTPHRAVSKPTESGTEKALTPDEHLVLLRGVENGMRSTIDHMLTMNSATSLSSTLSVSDSVPVYANALLMDFFKVCKFPNEAERHMLAEACGLASMWATDHWFSSKRREMQEWAAARALLHQRLEALKGRK